MKALISLSIAALAMPMLAGTAGAAETVSVAEAVAAGQTCRTIYTANSHDGVVACGDAEQWAEFDRRVALINASVTCNWAPTASQRLCLTEEQWKTYNRRVENHHQTLRMGAGVQPVSMSSGLAVTW